MNCRSLNCDNKKLQLVDAIRTNHIDIICLQETFFDNQKEINKLASLIEEYQLISPVLDQKARGVAVIVRKSLLGPSFKYEIIQKDRIMGLQISIGANQLDIINIYTPNKDDEQLDHLEKLYDIVASRRDLILMGDFNHVQDNKTDRRQSSSEKLSRVQEEWRDFYKSTGLREFDDFPKGNFTWTNGTKASRIDRIYLRRTKSSCRWRAKYTKLLALPLSDHKLIIGQLELETSKDSISLKGSRNWKLNNNTLKLPGIDQTIKSILAAPEKDTVTNVSAQYDQVMNKIRKVLIQAQRQSYLAERARIDNLIQEYNEMLETNDQVSLERRTFVKTEIDRHYAQVNASIKLKNRIMKKNFFKIPTKAILESEHRQAPSRRIDRLIIDEKPSDDPVKIIEHVGLFYKDLYSKKETRADANQYRFRMGQISRPSTLESLKKDFNFAELDEVIGQMQESSPGLNGLTVGFFKRYQKPFGSLLLRLINSDRFEPPKQFLESYVKLIPKGKSDSRSVNDYRPITISNIDYRIFAKMVANRVKLANAEIFGSNQLCSINDRKPQDLLNLTSGLIHDARTRNKQLLIASIDQYKAFDMISHEYLLQTLRHVNVDERTLRIVQEIYSRSTTRVLINGHFLDGIKVGKGLKQGCPLSMWLYMLCIEELLVRLDQNAKINGYETRIFDKQETKSRAYADDVTLFLANHESVQEARNDFKSWGEFSGARINDDKTQVLPINCQNSRKTSK